MHNRWECFSVKPNVHFLFQVFLHCVRNQTDGTDQDEQGRTFHDILKPNTNAGYETSSEAKAGCSHQDSPTLKHRAKRSLDHCQRAEGKGDTISSEESNLQRSSRSVDRSPDLKGTRMTLNNIPTSAEEQEMRIRSQSSLEDAVVVVDGEPAAGEQKNRYQNEQTRAVNAPSPEPYVNEHGSPQRAISRGTAVCDVDGLQEEPPHHHGSKSSVVSTGEEAVVVPVDYEESQRSPDRQRAGCRSSDTSSTGASTVPGLHDYIDADVINIRL